MCHQKHAEPSCTDPTHLPLVCRSHCGGRCAVGSGGRSVGYLAHGTATDYMYEVLGVPLSFTWEIYGDLKADYTDCFRMFNPLNAAVLEAVVQNWASAVLRLVELMPLHPHMATFLRETGHNVSSLRRHRRGATEAAKGIAQAQQQLKEQESSMQAAVAGLGFRTRKQKLQMSLQGKVASGQKRQPSTLMYGLSLGLLVFIAVALRLLYDRPVCAQLRQAMRKRQDQK